MAKYSSASLVAVMVLYALLRGKWRAALWSLVPVGVLGLWCLHNWLSLGRVHIAVLLAQRQAGAAILLISEELDELFALSDRVAVIYEGQIVGEVEGEDRETVGLMMTGHWQGAARPGRNASS